MLCITNRSHLFTHSWMFKQFYFKQFTLACHSFALSLNVKQFYLTHRSKTIRCYHSGPGWAWEQWQLRSTQHSLKLLHYWNLLIKLFNVISRTLVGWESFPSAEMHQYILLPQPTRLISYGDRPVSKRNQCGLQIKKKLLKTADSLDVHDSDNSPHLGCCTILPSSDFRSW